MDSIRGALCLVKLPTHSCRIQKKGKKVTNKETPPNLPMLRDLAESTSGRSDLCELNLHSRTHCKPGRVSMQDHKSMLGEGADSFIRPFALLCTSGFAHSAPHPLPLYHSFTTAVHCSQRTGHTYYLLNSSQRAVSMEIWLGLEKRDNYRARSPQKGTMNSKEKVLLRKQIRIPIALWNRRWYAQGESGSQCQFLLTHSVAALWPYIENLGRNHVRRQTSLLVIVIRAFSNVEKVQSRGQMIAKPEACVYAAVERGKQGSRTTWDGAWYDTEGLLVAKDWLMI